MANIALTAKATADREIRVVESFIQLPSYPASEAILEGAPVRFVTTTGRYANANGTTAPEARAIGIATHRCVAGQALTAIKKGILDGYVFDDQDYDEAIYLSDTDATLGDTAGTVSVVVGRVIPGFATTLGTAADKLLLVDL